LKRETEALDDDQIGGISFREGEGGGVGDCHDAEQKRPERRPVPSGEIEDDRRHQDDRSVERHERRQDGG
jgi:hypothetical protein